MAVKRWSGTAWEVYAGADVVPVKVTDGRPGKTTFIGATTPTGQVDGDIWIDQDTTTNAVVPTALTTKGDIFAATGNAAYTRLAAGNNGESLFADSSTSTGLRWQGDYTAGKNKFLNGDFSINQRNFISSTSAGYMFDRWFNYLLGGGTITFSAQTFSPGSAPVSGYEGKNYLRCVTTGQSAASSAVILYQGLEDVRSFAGQTITVSFWARAASGTPKISLEIEQSFGSGGSPSGGTLTYGGQVTISNTWTRYSITGTVPSISGRTIGTSSPGALYLGLWISGGSDFNSRTGSIGIQSNTFEFWGMQVEAGSIATPFTTNTANPQAELAACQRYYQKSYNTETAPGSATLAGIVVSAPSLSAVGSGLSFGHVPLKVDMRAAPSVVIYSYAGTVGVVSNGQPADLAASSGGVNTIGTRSFSLINNSGGSITPVNGSFIFHYTASAEL